jgi:signal transduction histidine kinase
LLGTPIALVSLVDATRQWFKAAQGLDVRETPREWAFCSHAILQQHEMVVLDASQDERFHDNPLVTDEPNIRFYAGSPLISPSGHALGTLCVIDRKPRSHFSQAERIVLSDLASIAMEILNLRMAGRGALREAASRAWTEAKLEKAIGQAESEEAARNRLLGHLAHEMRTPLNAVIGFSEVISTQTFGPLGNEKYVSYATDIHKAATHMLSIIDDQLATAKQEPNNHALFEQEFLLADLVNDAIALLDAQAQWLGVNLVHTASADRVSVKAHFRRLKQVLINVIGNAVKYSSPNSRVLIKYRHLKSGSLTIIIKDNGIGIPAAEMKSLFSDFYRASNAKAANIEGSGFGLALSREIMRQHGGDLRLRSTVGKGTTAIIELPGSRITTL